MKTIDTFLLKIFVLVFLAALTVPAAAQEADTDYFTVSGTVRDGGNHRPLANVSVFVPGTRVGTISNADGSFSLKIRRNLSAGEVEFSHVGYLRGVIRVDGTDLHNLSINLTQRIITLAEVEIFNRDPMELVASALSRIETNYADKNALLTGFYRETVQKRQKYTDISEAVVEIYTVPYGRQTRSESVRVVKGRRLVSPRLTDTLAVKLQGGPNSYIFCDVVKNADFVLDPQTLHFYRFRFENPVQIGERLYDVVSFEPQVTLEEQALYIGNLYIDHENLVISRAEFKLDLSDRDKATRMILRKKPFSLRFTPDEVSYVAAYRERNGRSYLNYVRNTIRFRCDWKRRLFRTNYTVISETVVTDGRDDSVSPIPYREAFRQSQSLSDRVGDFYDPDFWEGYNIIEPTESLESAVDRLRKQIE